MFADFLPPLLLFACVTSITPGPNNLMLLASGANFGFRRSLPHMLGISIGFTAMAALTGLGLAGLFAAWPGLHRILSAVSLAYLGWLAWRIARAGQPGGAGRTAGPMSFAQAAAFQWVNPKAWAMALTAVTVYAPGNTLAAALVTAAAFGAVNLPCVSSWCLLGTRLSSLLASPARLRAFNIAMATLLLASAVPVLI